MISAPIRGRVVFGAFFVHDSRQGETSGGGHIQTRDDGRARNSTIDHFCLPVVPVRHCRASAPAPCWPARASPSRSPALAGRLRGMRVACTSTPSPCRAAPVTRREAPLLRASGSATPIGGDGLLARRHAIFRRSALEVGERVPPLRGPANVDCSCRNAGAALVQYACHRTSSNSRDFALSLAEELIHASKPLPSSSKL